MERGERGEGCRAEEAAHVCLKDQVAAPPTASPWAGGKHVFLNAEDHECVHG